MTEPTQARVPSGDRRTECVGRFRVTVTCRESSDDAETWSGRAQRLARWLIEQWQQEQAARQRRPYEEKPISGPENFIQGGKDVP